MEEKGAPLKHVSFGESNDIGDHDATTVQLNRQSSTSRVAKYRATLCATTGGAEILLARSRSDSKKHYLKVKKSKLTISAYEELLGRSNANTETNRKTTTRTRGFTPKEEFQRMSMKALSEWRRQQHRDRKREASLERNETESIQS